jgi:hypothetical protein
MRNPVFSSSSAGANANTDYESIPGEAASSADPRAAVANPMYGSAGPLTGENQEETVYYDAAGPPATNYYDATAPPDTRPTLKNTTYGTTPGSSGGRGDYSNGVDNATYDDLEGVRIDAAVFRKGGSGGDETTYADVEDSRADGTYDQLPAVSADMSGARAPPVGGVHYGVGADTYSDVPGGVGANPYSGYDAAHYDIGASLYSDAGARATGDGANSGYDAPSAADYENSDDVGNGGYIDVTAPVDVVHDKPDGEMDL